MTKVSDKPLISIIIPIYNVEKYLTKCLDSIINQTYKNLEIILVDDGSSDNCPKICDEYAKKDKRIKVIHKQNGGLSDARNEGIKIAKGKYVGFVDSDDWISSNFYEYLYHLIDEYGADISVCGFTKVNNEIEHVNLKKELISVFNQQEYLKKYFKIKNQTTEYYVWNKLYKKELITNDQFPINLTSEDVFGTYKAILKSKKIVKSNFELYFYRYNENGITGKFSKKDYDLLKIWDLVVDYTKDNAKKYENYAILNRKRINFTLLYRLAKNYSRRSLKNMDIVAKLLNDLKKDEKFLLKSNIVLSRKIAIFLFCRNYYFIAKFL